MGFPYIDGTHFHSIDFTSARTLTGELETDMFGIVSIDVLIGLITIYLAFAVSLGVPFWFDIRKRFMKVRQSGISPTEKKGKDKS